MRGVIEAQTESTSTFLYIIIFQRRNLSSPLAPLSGDGGR